MFKLVVALILALTVGWKIGLGLINNQDERDDFNSVLVEFLVRQHFAAFEDSDISGVKAVSPDCRLLITKKETRVWDQDSIKRFASADDRVFFVYRQAVYTTLPNWSIVIDQYWSRFLRKMQFKRPTESAIIAVIASPRCNIERLPWHEVLPS
jgi:hypothetical protein